MSTKKVGSTGRFGARYGRRIKVRVLEVERLQKQRHECPACTKKTLKRLSKGVWECASCGMKMAGGAYYPDVLVKRAEKAKATEVPAQEAAEAKEE